MATGKKNNLERYEGHGRPSKREMSAALLSRLDGLRKAQGLSWKRLSVNAGLSASTLDRLRFKQTDPRLTTVLKLAGALNLSLEELLLDVPVPRTPKSSSRRARATDDPSPMRD
jgi:transcriptional regulator with XRE-family HTH domain